VDSSLIPDFLCIIPVFSFHRLCTKSRIVSTRRSWFLLQDNGRESSSIASLFNRIMSSMLNNVIRYWLLDSKIQAFGFDCSMNGIKIVSLQSATEMQTAKDRQQNKRISCFRKQLILLVETHYVRKLDCDSTIIKYCSLT
jgi:hypothetical protein